jgi:hypothetical protein
MYVWLRSEAIRGPLSFKVGWLPFRNLDCCILNVPLDQSNANLGAVASALNNHSGVTKDNPSLTWAPRSSSLSDTYEQRTVTKVNNVSCTNFFFVESARVEKVILHCEHALEVFSHRKQPIIWRSPDQFSEAYARLVTKRKKEEASEAYSMNMDRMDGMSEQNDDGSV